MPIKQEYKTLRFKFTSDIISRPRDLPRNTYRLSISTKAYDGMCYNNIAFDFDILHERNMKKYVRLLDRLILLGPSKKYKEDHDFYKLLGTHLPQSLNDLGGYKKELVYDTIYSYNITWYDKDSVQFAVQTIKDGIVQFITYADH